MWIVDDDRSDEFQESHPSWSIVQLVLAAMCTMSLASLVKLQEHFYFGSGWSLISVFLFVFLIGWPLLYLQIRLGNQYQRGNLSIFKKFFPLSYGFGLAMIIRNIISIIYVSSIMTHSLSYIFYSVYPCDKRYCISTGYMWRSCEDEWNRKLECRPQLFRTQQGPTPEEGFYLYFNMDISETISQPWFPRWFLMDGLIVVPHIINWIFILLTVVWGPRVYGMLLYVLAPLALILYGIVYGVVLANYPWDSQQRDSSGAAISATPSTSQRQQYSAYMQRFYSNFASNIPLDTNAWDRYSFQPLVWGILGTTVQMCSGLHLWHGVWVSVGSWVKRGRKTMHMSFLPVLLLFALLIQLPVSLSVISYASAFNIDYLRCHVAHSFAHPFTLMPHIFSKFSISPVFAVCYFVAVYLFLLLAQSLLLVTSVDSIVDQLQSQHRSVERNRRRTYRMIAGIACFVMFPLSFTFIIKAGYWWLRLMDTFMDRMLVLTVIGSGIGYFIAYYRVKSKALVPRLLYLICLGLSLLVLAGVYCWYAANTTAEPPISDCFYQTSNTGQPGISGAFNAIGWLTAAGPPVLGFCIGLIVMLCRSDTECSSVCSHLIYGDFLAAEDLLAQHRREQQFQLQSMPGTMAKPGHASDV